MKSLVTLPAGKARARLFRLIDSVAESHEPIQLVGKRNSAILLNEADWRSIQETLYLSMNTRLRKSIVRGLKTPHKKMAKSLKW